MKARLILLIVLGSALALSAAQAGSIGGVIFEDRNRDGAFDAADAPLANIQVGLLGAHGSVLRLARSGADGRFLFSGLANGHYVLTAPPVAGLRASLPLRRAEPAPISDFPFGLPRYGTMPWLAPRLYRSAQLGRSVRHVALGDSIGFGFNFCGSLLGEDGYIEPTTQRLRGSAAATVITDKQAIPGDETFDLLDPGYTFPLGYNDIFYAIDQGAGVVSMSIGGNDFLGAEGGGDAALAAALVTARQNLQEIASSLASELPYTGLSVNTVYDNLEGQDALHNVWAPIWDQVLRELAWGQTSRMTVAEIYPEYAHLEGGQILGEPGLICQALGLDGIHPTKNGYDVHEEKLWQSFGGVSLAGGDQTSFDLGFFAVDGEQTAAGYTDVTGGTQNPDRALARDGVGALIPSNNAEFRLSGFLPPIPPGQELAQAVLRIRYRTTAAPLDDIYRFEASVDGSFSPPGNTPTTWNTILPVVGSSGISPAVPLAYPDQPRFREVATPIYVGAPTDGTPTLTWDDLATLSVRLVTIARGAGPDAYSVEWDAAWVELYTVPAGAGAPRDPAAELARLVGRDRAAGRDAVLAALAASRDDVVAAALLSEVCNAGDASLLARLLAAREPLVRGHAVRAAGCLTPADRASLLATAAHDPDPGVRRAVARGMTASGDAGAAALLRRLAADVDPGVRQAAARGLAGQPGTEEVLRSLLLSDPEPAVRVEAAAGLLPRGDDAALDVLLRAALAMPPVPRARGVLAARAAGDGRLVSRLADERPGVRALAARLLGLAATVPPGALPALRMLLADPDPGVRAAAMGALARLGDRDSVGAMGRLVGQQELLVDAAQALAALGGGEAVAPLAEIAGNRTAPATARRAAVRGLALSGEPAARALLEELVRDDDVRVRRLAQAGLARLEAPRR